MVLSISDRATLGTWQLSLPSAQEIDAADEALSCALEMKSEQSAAVAVVLASFVQHRNEMITCGLEPTNAKLGGAPESEDNMLVELSDEQIEAAARYLYGLKNNCLSVLDSTDHALRWNAVPNQESFRNTVRRLAPLLQVPRFGDVLATQEGIDYLAGYIGNCLGSGIPIKTAIERFAQERHDFPRQRILLMLLEKKVNPSDALELADAILAELDRQ